MAMLHLVSGGTAPVRPAAPRDPSARPARRPGRPAGPVRPVGGQRPSTALRSVGAARPAAVRPVGAARPAARVRPEPPLRLTRRGRIVVRTGTALLVVAGVVAAVLLGVRPAMAGTWAHPVPVRHHVVMSGETLLQIAAEEVPGVDPRDTAVRIKQLNALSDSRLAIGQDLALPVGS